MLLEEFFGAVCGSRGGCGVGVPGLSEEWLVRNCAPTLAGLKTGSLFSCPCPRREALVQELRGLNHQLQGKGLRIVPLRLSTGRALVYLYRPRRLQLDMGHALARQLLRERGYDPEDSGRCVVQLMRRLRAGEEFPHEIGLFLGYPPEDVRGFIVHRAQDCKCVGCWKVYGDVEAARQQFSQFEKCTRIYCQQWRRGKDIRQLAVAG